MTTQTNRTDAEGVQATGEHAKQATADVASTAADEARNVAHETRAQARQLWDQARSDLTDQAGTQQQRAAEGLRTLADQLGAMARNAEDGGPARDLVDDVARRAGTAAGWLEDRDPGALLDETRRFAQRRPGTFLAVAAGLGVLAGRMSRGMAAGEPSGSPSTSGGGSATTDGVSATGSSSTSGTSSVGSGSSTSRTDGLEAGSGLGALGDDAGVPNATSPREATTGTTPTTPGASPQTAAVGGATLPDDELPGVHRQTQPIEPDGSPTPIGEDGLLEGPGDLGRSGR